MFTGFALSSALPSYHRGRGAGATGVDKEVPDLTPTRDQIRSVKTSAELGRGFGFGLYRHRGGPSAVS